MNQDEKELTALFDELVPAQGKAESVAGEMVRAVNRIIYRYINDGDRVGIDYGKVTCNPAARYLLASDLKIISYIALALFDTARSHYDYEDVLDDLGSAVVQQIKEHPELRTMATDDMLEYADSDEDFWGDDQYCGEGDELDE